MKYGSLHEELAESMKYPRDSMVSGGTVGEAGAVPKKEHSKRLTARKSKLPQT